MISVESNLLCSVDLAMDSIKSRFKVKQVLDGGVSTEIASTHGHGYIDVSHFTPPQYHGYV